MNTSADFEPRLIGFTCNWCSYRAADLAGTARMKYAPNMPLVRLMCAGRLDPAFILKAFAEGADGVMVSGCWPGDCHYREQNYKGLRRLLLLRRVLGELGIEPQRLQLVWASAAEGERLAKEINRIVEDIRILGPLAWPRDRALPAMAALDLGPDDGPETADVDLGPEDATSSAAAAAAAEAAGIPA